MTAMTRARDGDAGDSRTVLDTLGAQQGDEHAYTRLFDRHYPRILRATALRLGLHIGSCDADVESAVQEAFFDAFQRLRQGDIPDIHTPGAFRRYVARAAKNRVIDTQRRRAANIRGGGKVRRISSVLGDASSSLLGMLAGGAAHTGRDDFSAEREARLEQAILELEEPYRTAIELRYVCGMSPREIAETGELRAKRDHQPIRRDAHVRLVLFRARDRLRDKLGADFIGPGDGEPELD